MSFLESLLMIGEIVEISMTVIMKTILMMLIFSFFSLIKCITRTRIHEIAVSS